MQSSIATAVMMIGLASGAISLLMSKPGPWRIFERIKNAVGQPLQCEVCRPGWLAAAMWFVLFLVTFGSIETMFGGVMFLLILPASWGVAYVVTGLNGVMWE